MILVRSFKIRFRVKLRTGDEVMVRFGIGVKVRVRFSVGNRARFKVSKFRLLIVGFKGLRIFIYLILKY